MTKIKTLYEECLNVWKLMASDESLYADSSLSTEEVKLLAWEELGLLAKYEKYERMSFCPACILDEALGGVCNNCGLVNIEAKNERQCAPEFYAFDAKPSTERASKMYKAVKSRWLENYKSYYLDENDNCIKHLNFPDYYIPAPIDEDEDDYDE